MRRSYDDDDYRSKNMSSHDYHDHISRLARMPSAVTTDVPRYGLAPRFYHTPKKVTSHETEETKQEDHHNNNNKQNKKQHQHPQFEEKVEIFEYHNSSTTNDEDVKSTNTVNNQVSEESSINDVASSYIQQKRKAFELYKWKTFSVR
ncbi:hypothetical protein PanWU01x14_066810 [Parasponia andersonii]|uniref:Uncharacterized protein n=1 Tax=Parasponia andersonii TaxID=3476 RepID=A0A2P5DG77_PARAD|nr:hypothetical protein PanWU01x14_066810 [Parasponia andersonii]